MTSLLLRGVEMLDRAGRWDVRMARDKVVAVRPKLRPAPADTVVEASGGVLLPGLHDHHVHLLAAAAAVESVACGPPEVIDDAELALALRTAPPGPWLRGVGYVESVAGQLDRIRLDALVSDRPARLQHRSGAEWVINTAGLAALGLPTDGDGRLRRRDGELARRLRAVDSWSGPPDLLAHSRQLLATGITSVTDATPGNGDAILDRADPGIDITVMGVADDWLPDPSVPWLRAGPRKLVLDAFDLPTFDELCSVIQATHAAGRPVAIHAVDAVSLAFLLAVLDHVGSRPGDRVEHSAVTPPGAHEQMRRLGLTVVTQPAILAARGDDYYRDVDPGTVGDLWHVGSFVRHGVPIAASSDAPYGTADPWQVIVAARDRRAPSGRIIGAAERVSTREALGGFLTSPDEPGGAERRLETGSSAACCLLHVPLSEALQHPSADLVRFVVGPRGASPHHRHSIWTSDLRNTLTN